MPEKDRESLCCEGSGMVVVVDTFLAYLVGLKRSPKTVTIRRNALKKFVCFLSETGAGERVQDVSAETLERYRGWLYEQPLKGNTVQNYLRSLKLFFDWLEDGLMVFVNPSSNLVVPRPSKPLPQVLSEAEILRVLEGPDLGAVLGRRDRAIMEVLYGTGMRREECAQLTMQDVMSGADTVRVIGKGHKERVLPLGETAAEWIGLYLEQSRPELAARGQGTIDALWLSQKGRALSMYTLGAIPRQYGWKAGVGGFCSAHTLRRSCVTHMLAHGAHPAHVAEMLGHADLKTLAHYLRITLADLRETHRRSNPGK